MSRLTAARPENIRLKLLDQLFDFLGLQGSFSVFSHLDHHRQKAHHPRHSGFNLKWSGLRTEIDGDLFGNPPVWQRGTFSGYR